MDIEELKKKAHNLDPVMRIGKNGVNENTVEELKKLLKKRKLVKVKILKSASIEDKDAMIETLVSDSCSNLVSKIGNTFTLWKK